MKRSLGLAFAGRLADFMEVIRPLLIMQVI
jgi:hypothetical protein